MNIKKICGITLLILLFGIINRSGAQAPAEDELFPDIPGVEKIVWHCDERGTIAVIYVKTGEWARSVILTEIKIFTSENMTNGTARYFTALYGESKLHEVPSEQYRADLALASPNYAKQLRGEPNDCVDSKSLQPEHR